MAAGNQSGSVFIGRARPETIELAIERTRAEIHDPLQTTGMRAAMVEQSNGECGLAAELRRNAQRRLAVLNGVLGK